MFFYVNQENCIKYGRRGFDTMDTKQLLEITTRPPTALIEEIRQIDGDIMILGAGGKVGPSLAIMAKRACDFAGEQKRVFAVSNYENEEIPAAMRSYGVDSVNADLFDSQSLAALPDVKNIIFMAGRKFGTSDNQSLTWAVNVLLPYEVCKRFPFSNFVVFSTGNVYGDVSALSGGSVETNEPRPDGEYGQTCLGRERVFEYFAGLNGTKSLLFRLNYSIGLNYGVLFDIANSVYEGTPVNLSRGIYNCIWQGDVCAYAIRALLHCTNPPNILNVTGAQRLSVRWTANEFAHIFGKSVRFSGEERALGIYSNTTKLNSLMGVPEFPLDDMIRLQAEWIAGGGASLNAPTHFEQADGKY